MQTHAMFRSRRDQSKIAQHFQCWVHCATHPSSPVGTAETLTTRPSSAVPLGLEFLITRLYPALKVLGYCRVSLRDINRR